MVVDAINDMGQEQLVTSQGEAQLIPRQCSASPACPADGSLRAPMRVTRCARQRQWSSNVGEGISPQRLCSNLLENETPTMLKEFR